jgi:hypothetical protein
MAVEALARRDGYDPAARVELFGELAACFRSLVEFPEAALEGLTDEQYGAPGDSGRHGAFIEGSSRRAAESARGEQMIGGTIGAD